MIFLLKKFSFFQVKNRFGIKGRPSTVTQKYQQRQHQKDDHDRMKNLLRVTHGAIKHHSREAHEQQKNLPRNNLARQGVVSIHDQGRQEVVLKNNFGRQRVDDRQGIEGNDSPRFRRDADPQFKRFNTGFNTGFRNEFSNQIFLMFDFLLSKYFLKNA